METAEVIAHADEVLVLHNNRKRVAEGQRIFELLPQGEGSRLNADMVDGKHAKEIVEEAREGFVVKAAGSGGGGLAQHGNEFHTPDFLPKDGSEGMKGDLLPAADGLFLGETTTPKRWDGSKLLGVIRQDGSLPMTGDFDIASKKLLTTNLAFYQKDVNTFRITNRAITTTKDLELKNLYVDSIISATTIRARTQSTELTIQAWAGGSLGDIVFSTSTGSIAARLTTAGEFIISRAGDIIVLDTKSVLLGNDSFVLIGKDSDDILPTPNATYRGKMIRVEATLYSGLTDRVAVCIYRDPFGDYVWKDLVSGEVSSDGQNWSL